eukprot:TRINITY_DN48_c0_g1_i3.p3 TRINITY_DN48_c0_g1~~TRINITY_DN48_c0_g1_i3.p3  ORF type:complete len:428 (-),score=82.28 TRINITY_DN48_c0_g1_i3:8269-9552(-)
MHKRSFKRVPSPEESPVQKVERKTQPATRKIEKRESKKVGKHTLKKKNRAKSMKPKKERERSFDEGKLSEHVLTGDDYRRRYYKSLSKSVRDLNEASITIPKPFRFAEREETKRKSIRQQWLEEMIEEKEIEEENMLNHQFRANPIPASTKLPMYEMIKEKNETRRAEVKKNSIALTKSREKPFSFYERDKDFYVNRAKASEQNIPEEIKNHKQFKATPIPWSVSAQLLDQMKEKEEKEREERVKKRAQELLALSKLPPRMEMHEMSKKQGAIIKPVPKGQEYSFQPQRAKPVPNFEVQHRTFQKTLEKHKKLNQPTVAKPFEFRETKKRANIREYMDLENAPQIELKPKTAQTPKIMALEKPSINPPTTAKMTASMELRRKRLEEKRKKEIEKQKEEQYRKDKLKKVYFEFYRNFIVGTNTEKPDK